MHRQTRLSVCLFFRNQISPVADEFVALYCEMEIVVAKLDSAVAIITGASSGIGKATAELFASEGAAIVVVHHDHSQDARNVLETIEAAGGRAIAVSADVRNEMQVDMVFEKAREAFGAPTLLINSAGMDAAGIEVSDMELDHFEQVLHTNLIGPFLFCRAFVRGCKAEKVRGKIINITSVHEEIPRAGAADYCASKGGLRNLTRCLALELAEHGITVNNLAPGMVLTPMNQEAMDDPEVLKKQVQSIPLKRAAQPEEVAGLAVYLASKEADYVTGTTMTIDGGLEIYTGQGA